MADRKCIKCAETKPVSGFYKTSKTCRACRLAIQRERRRANGNADTLKYEKSKKGFLMRAYRNMKSRITGVQQAKFHLYEGKRLLPKDQFYEWAINSKDFHRLFDAWEAGGYDRKLTPSVDRVDSDHGYWLWNMEWVTHSENSRRGAVSKVRAERREAA
jgi:hypothetical protein